jgi:hypothetical protein
MASAWFDQVATASKTIGTSPAFCAALNQRGAIIRASRILYIYCARAIENAISELSAAETRVRFAKAAPKNGTMI